MVWFLKCNENVRLARGEGLDDWYHCESRLVSNVGVRLNQRTRNCESWLFAERIAEEFLREEFLSKASRLTEAMLQRIDTSLNLTTLTYVNPDCARRIRVTRMGI
jgi:hypothetical protein